VERSFGSGGGDPRIENVMDADSWYEYCVAYGG
jgi:hypothetical protein